MQWPKPLALSGFMPRCAVAGKARSGRPRLARVPVMVGARTTTRHDRRGATNTSGCGWHATGATTPWAAVPTPRVAIRLSQRASTAVAGESPRRVRLPAATRHRPGGARWVEAAAPCPRAPSRDGSQGWESAPGQATPGGGMCYRARHRPPVDDAGGPIGWSPHMSPLTVAMAMPERPSAGPDRVRWSRPTRAGRGTSHPCGRRQVGGSWPQGWTWRRAQWGGVGHAPPDRDGVGAGGVAPGARATTSLGGSHVPLGSWPSRGRWHLARPAGGTRDPLASEPPGRLPGAGGSRARCLGS